MTTKEQLTLGIVNDMCQFRGGVIWVNFCWVCAAGLSEPKFPIADS